MVDAPTPVHVLRVRPDAERLRAAEVSRRRLVRDPVPAHNARRVRSLPSGAGLGGHPRFRVATSC